MSTQLLQVLRSCKQIVDALVIGEGISYDPLDMLRLSNHLAIEIKDLASYTGEADDVDSSTGDDNPSDDG